MIDSRTSLRRPPPGLLALAVAMLPLALPTGVVRAGEAAPSGAAVAAPTTGAPAGDWPCVQRKVDNIALSQVWDGPPVEEIKDWQDDEAIAKLITYLATRKYSIEDATAAIEKFSASQPDAERDTKLVKLFAGYFQTVAAERRTIISGIVKYSRRQKEKAEIIEGKGKTIAELESKSGQDEAAAAELAKLQEEYDWDTRIFKERNDNLPIACELPVLLDQRLFEVAKSIRGLMKS
ncbi:MAG: hypothetical protein ACT4N2_04560 [Hyphomicrobium sp.]